MTDNNIIIREATQEEYDRLVAWTRWAYEHGLLIALWEDGTLTLAPSNPGGWIGLQITK